MTAMQYMNITAVILCCIICFILLLCISTSEYRKEKLNWVFIPLVCCHIILSLVDTAIFVLEGGTGQFINFIFWAAYCLSFVLGSVLLMLFTRYLQTFIEIKTAISKKAVYVLNSAIAVSGINIIFVIITQFNGMYYFTDNSNLFYQGDWYWLSQLSAIICILLNTGIMLAYRKCFSTRELIFLLSYTVLPILALFVQNMIEGAIASIDVATTLTIVIFYAGIQSEQAKQLKQMELELTESRIAIMLSQIQPHFLYNSLVVIKQLCDIDPAKAKEAVVEFSTYLRSNMDSIELKRPILFENELKHVENYLSLEKKRFGDIIEIIYDIQATGFMLPALTLQPIVENAIRYGLTKKEKGGTVTISTNENKKSFIVIVADDGIGFDTTQAKQDGRSHIGIENVKSRIEAMSGGSLHIESIIGGGTTVTIEILKGAEIK